MMRMLSPSSRTPHGVRHDEDTPGRRAAESRTLFSIYETSTMTAKRATRLGQRGERDEAAAVPAPIRVEKLGMTRGAQPRILDRRRSDAGVDEQRLVRRPEIEHHVAGA